MKAEDKHKKIAQQKARLELKEKQLKEKERKEKLRHLIELGKLMAEIEIDHLETNALRGALLDIKKQAAKENQIKLWAQMGEEFNKQKQSDDLHPLIISFP